MHVRNWETLSPFPSANYKTLIHRLQRLMPFSYLVNDTTHKRNSLFSLRCNHWWFVSFLKWQKLISVYFQTHQPSNAPQNIPLLFINALSLMSINLLQLNYRLLRWLVTGFEWLAKLLIDVYLHVLLRVYNLMLTGDIVDKAIKSSWNSNTNPLGGPYSVRTADCGVALVS